MLRLQSYTYSPSSALQRNPSLGVCRVERVERGRGSAAELREVEPGVPLKPGVRS